MRFLFTVRLLFPQNVSIMFLEFYINWFFIGWYLGEQVIKTQIGSSSIIRLDNEEVRLCPEFFFFFF